MPRGLRAKAEADKAIDASGWLDADQAERTLQRLCGLWRDRMGSTYALRLASEGVVELRTTRPRGRTLRTRDLIRVQWSEDYGRVIWGRPGGGAFFRIARLEDHYLVWKSNRCKSYHWDRVADVCPGDDEMEDELGDYDSEAEDSAWRAPYGGAAWDVGWEEGWDDGWWEEEEEEAEEEGEEEVENWWEPSQETASDAAKRRTLLRKKLQETRRQVAGQVSGAEPVSVRTETSARRWKQKEVEKPVYRKVERPEESEKNAAARDASRDASGAPEAGKPLPGPRMQQRKGRAGTREWQAKVPAKEVPADPPEPAPAAAAQVPAKEEAAKPPEPASAAAAAAAQEAAAAEPELRPPTGRSPGVGASSEDHSARGSLPLRSPPPSSRQERSAACALGHSSREAGERLPPGVTSKSCSFVADANTSVGSSYDASAPVSRLEHVLQGFLGLPWFTPAWSSNSSGWAFDLNWVTSTLEWYFSDMSLQGNAYLRSLMMPGEGWVPLLLLLPFPRLRMLGVDPVVLGTAAMVTASLELDITGHYARIRDKRRRAQWLPAHPG